MEYTQKEYELAYQMLTNRLNQADDVEITDEQVTLKFGIGHHNFFTGTTISFNQEGIINPYKRNKYPVGDFAKTFGWFFIEEKIREIKLIKSEKKVGFFLKK